MARGKYSPAKTAFANKLVQLVSEHDRILVISVDHVGSSQLASIRVALRGKGILLMGKNTTVKAVLQQNADNFSIAESLRLAVSGNCGFVFCKADVSEIKDIINQHRVPAAAKQGVVAPFDVYVEPGPTGMDPSQTSFFQAIGVATKIVKGQIEIQSSVKVITEKEKVSASAAVLLQKLKLMPFSQGVVFRLVFDQGISYDASVLDIKTDDIIGWMKNGLKNFTALCLGAAHPTAASVHHSIIAGFRNCASIALANDYMFPQLEAMMNSAQSAPAAAPAPTAAKTEAKAAAPAPPEPESDDDVGFSLFD